MPYEYRKDEGTGRYIPPLYGAWNGLGWAADDGKVYVSTFPLHVFMAIADSKGEAVGFEVKEIATDNQPKEVTDTEFLKIMEGAKKYERRRLLER